MAETVKVLGQEAPAATTVTDLYTVPAATSAVCSTLVVANRGATAVTYRVAVVPSGDVLADKHYQMYDVPLDANDSVFLTIGITLATGDKVKVYASNGNMSFSLYGVQIT